MKKLFIITTAVIAAATVLLALGMFSDDSSASYSSTFGSDSVGAERIVFDSNGGSGGYAQYVLNGNSVYFPTEYKAPGTSNNTYSQISRNGYVLTGWSESSSASSPTYFPGQSYTVTVPKTFYAVWTPVAYTVTYHANGGTGSPPAAETHAAGESVTIRNAALQKTDYQFAGWSTDSQASLVDYKAGSSFKMPRANVDLYAVYMPTEFPYNGSDGTDGSVQSFTAPVDGTYQIQLWGARGGSSCRNGVANGSDRGGYTVINVVLTKGQTIYFAVGGHGANNAFTNMSGANVNPGGWNGGGNGYTDAALEEGSFTSAYREGSGGGGGATAVYTALAGNGQLSSYSGRKGSILGVAGGSSGANYEGSDGYGGGTRGGNGNYGGTQTTGYAFGRGESATGARRIQ